MIQLSRLNHVPLILNSDLIQHIETTPDTVIVLTNGQKIVVTETSGEVVAKIVEYRRVILKQLGCPLTAPVASAIRIDLTHGD